MYTHALKDIEVGKHSRRPLDPSDIEFRFYYLRKSPMRDGETEEEYELITHTYDECKHHNCSSELITDKNEIDIAKIHLLCAELVDIVKIIKENDFITEDEYVESLLDDLRMD